MQRSFYLSPLRYPGGKSRISGFLEDIILLNNLEGCTLYELYAGGAGASLNLLESGMCGKIVLNDLDMHIYSFWYSVLYETDEFLKLINDSPVNVENWHKQRMIYEKPSDHTALEIGFSTFFLNRCNRSGILYKAGPIGGFNQTGNYKIDVRFNKSELSLRIKRIAALKDRIVLKNEESISILTNAFSDDETSRFFFLDPPYYVQGEHLYFSCYEDDDHVKLRDLLVSHQQENWFLTYDNADRIIELYQDCRTAELDMSYTLQTKRKAKEVMAFSDNLYLPKKLRIGSKTKELLINE